MREFDHHPALLPTHRKKMKKILFFGLVLFLAALSFPWIQPGAFGGDIEPEYILDMDIEDLMKAEVTSVSKYGQLLLDAPAAITVLDDTMIQRSGLRHLPEILRMAPGLQVVRFGGNAWSVSARSMPNLGDNKLLVLSDGRSIYSEAVSTVLWEMQDYCLEDLDRIEVIQGPGGAIWGFNAFDGVVNIISKKAKETQGGVVDAGVDYRGSAFFQTRYGGRIKENLFYRLYYAGATLEAFETPAGYSAEDWLKRSKFGLRFDVEPAGGSLLFLDAAISRVSGGDGFQSSEFNFEDAYLHGLYELAVNRNLDFEIQAYYDANDQVYGKTSFGEALTLGVENIDGEIQMDWRIGDRHRVAAGVGFRYSIFSTKDGYDVDFEEDGDELLRYNLFLTDEIALIPGRLWFTLGAKMEYNDLTGHGLHPSVRLLYKPTPSQSLWASVSRALRTPDYSESAPQIFNGEDFFLKFTGEPLEDETITSYEMGHRVQLTADLSSELALFYNVRDNLLTSGSAEMDPSGLILLYNGYGSELRAHGAELAINWRALESWILRGSCSYLYTVQDFDIQEFMEPFEPPRIRHERWQFQLHSRHDPTENISFDAHLYYGSGATDEYARLAESLRVDLGFSWRPSEMIEFSLVGRNLFDSGRQEMRNIGFEEYYPEIPREIVVNMKVRF